MKNNLNRKPNFIIVVVIFIIALFIYGDDEKDDLHTISIIIPKIALLDIESVNSKNVKLKMEAPQEAGDPLISATDDRIWLNITSVVERGNARNITVKISENIDGIDLKIMSEPYAGSGYGSWGTPQPMITLNTADQNLVMGIKSGETGDGAHNGYNLKYVAQSNNTDYGMITNNNTKDITVTYTLTH